LTVSNIGEAFTRQGLALPGNS